VIRSRAAAYEKLPGPLQSRAGGLTEPQIIALRFASDAELPALVEKRWPAPGLKQITTVDQTWRPRLTAACDADELKLRGNCGPLSYPKSGDSPNEISALRGDARLAG